MMNKTVPHMGPSVVGGGGVSQWRKSYSVNMQPDSNPNPNPNLKP